jgi:uncharacterized membrane protein
METFSTIHPIQRNVREICRMEDEALRTRSAAERLGDFVAKQAGRIWFIELHILWFATWVLLNSGKLTAVKPFDPFPYPFLTLVVSLEAIFLSLFILMSQNRAGVHADRRAHLDLQINLLAEHESTKTLELLKALCEHHGLPCSQDPEVAELISRTKPSEILHALKGSLPADREGNSPRKIIS